MKLYLIRHGDPDYMHDCLTAKGRKEAQLLARRTKDMDLGDVYVSPMGRARETASYTLKASGKTAQTADWIMEFLTDLNLNHHPELVQAYGRDTPRMKDTLKDIARNPAQEGYLSYFKLLHPESVNAYLPDKEGQYPEYAPRIVWDILPSYMAKHPELYSAEDWMNSDLASAAHLPECSEYVFSRFDAMLARHGYRKEKTARTLYRAEHPNTGAVTCFCHLGITCLLVAYLTGQSPFAVWEHFAFAPTSVTEFVSEEREQTVAIFRALRLGDISHLYAAGEEPSFSARFCETFDNTEQRH